MKTAQKSKLQKDIYTNVWETADQRRRGETRDKLGALFDPWRVEKARIKTASGKAFSSTAPTKIKSRICAEAHGVTIQMRYNIGFMRLRSFMG